MCSIYLLVASTSAAAAHCVVTELKVKVDRQETVHPLAQLIVNVLFITERPNSLV